MKKVAKAVAAVWVCSLSQSTCSLQNPNTFLKYEGNKYIKHTQNSSYISLTHIFDSRGVHTDTCMYVMYSVMLRQVYDRYAYA